VAETARLVAAMRPDGTADLRRALAGPLAVAVVAEALGLSDADPATVLGWYAAIVGSVSALTGEPGPGPGREDARQGQDRRDKAGVAGAGASGSLSGRLTAVIESAGEPPSLLAGAAGAGGDAAAGARGDAATGPAGDAAAETGGTAGTAAPALTTPEVISN